MLCVYLKCAFGENQPRISIPNIKSHAIYTLEQEGPYRFIGAVHSDDDDDAGLLVTPTDGRVH